MANFARGTVEITQSLGMILLFTSAQCCYTRFRIVLEGQGTLLAAPSVAHTARAVSEFEKFFEYLHCVFWVVYGMANRSRVGIDFVVVASLMYQFTVSTKLRV